MELTNRYYLRNTAYKSEHRRIENQDSLIRSRAPLVLYLQISGVWLEVELISVVAEQVFQDRTCFHRVLWAIYIGVTESIDVTTIGTVSPRTYCRLFMEKGAWSSDELALQTYRKPHYRKIYVSVPEGFRGTAAVTYPER